MRSTDTSLKFMTRSGLMLQKLVRFKDGERYLSKKWHLRVQHNGVRRWIPLAENPKTAEGMANDIVGILDSSDGHSMTIAEALKVLEQRDQRPPIRPNQFRKTSTLGQLRDVVELNAGNLGVTQETAKEYFRSIGTIVRDVLRSRENLPKKPSMDKVMAQPVGLLNASLLFDFKGLRLPPHLREHTSKGRKAKLTANRHMRNAQALFMPDRVAFLRDKELHIPDMEPFRSVPMFQHATERYNLPPAAFMLTLVKQIMTDLANEDSAMYCATLLALHAGLRREEIVHAKWDWFIDEPTGLVVHVRPEDEFAPKFGLERKVKVSRWLHAELLRFKSKKEACILPDYARDHNVDIVTRLVAWLKAHGVTAIKPIHELRKWFGSFFATEYSITTAQRQLGHSTPMVTNAHYAGINFHPALRIIWFEPALSAALPELLALLDRPNGVGDGIERDALGFPVKRHAQQAANF
ncbi:hypothetical protein ESB00_17580 [Oleiharenicola lentus]|uniref:Tyr recombinase domain-containing protein n=1 Tax=Oleiharenicola lentus TaxID=2508720 RepID=A0A4Q1C4Y9_9BACT|nr:tyrosine-type recombinase/integrase [Oleiharenicola lentus]RXK53504.1 hypothetical protein ESB00_17580 [Oleiharenicola lentus]